MPSTKARYTLHSLDSIADVEKALIKKWKKNKVRDGVKSYVLYDGPPFANGMPHYGHLLTSFIKDTFIKYHSMLGKVIQSKFGWDCHGLPAEMHASKELGISSKKEIEEYGVNKFNKKCASSVLTYTKEWRDYITRQGRIVNFEDEYKTMDLSYSESVIWAFNELFKKGLIYESMRVMPYSWACETPVSDFETKMDNAYRKKESKSITVAFKLNERVDGVEGEVYLLAWTTTPWTLPSNLAIAINAKLIYVCASKGGRNYIIAQGCIGRYKEIVGDVVKTIPGSALKGLGYEPLFGYFKDAANAFKVLDAEFVGTDDGTGIVHIAPGFGEDDSELCSKNYIGMVCPVDSTGKFTDQVQDYKGLQVFDANELIIRDLKKRDLVIKVEQYTHNYPYCWRTDTPLIYKAVSSWYLKVTAIKDKMIKNNEKINWIPSHIKDGLFGNWLKNARDWSISRNRYWGCPIPIWKSDDPNYPHMEVYGSIKEIEEAFDVKVSDFHKDFADSLVRPNPKDPTGLSKMRRVPEILDCWFESGSMPFAQLHYPFENKKLFQKSFPADFAVEYLSQTRGWFYTMLVISTALFKEPPFLNCLCHGVILGEDGQKLSKRLGNYVDPMELFDEVGADSVRLFMLSSTLMKGQELVLSKQAIIEKQRNVIKPLYNAYNFFALYSNADGIRGLYNTNISDKKSILDKYILSKCIDTAKRVLSYMDAYDTISAIHALEGFVEILTNWYIRRSRERFWCSEISIGKVDAYNTLFTVMSIICTVCAPVIPFAADHIFSSISMDDDVSVFDASFPKLGKYDEKLIRDMEKVRDACGAALRIRNNLGIRTRQPLAKVIFVGIACDYLSDELKNIVLDEINVKKWENVDKSEISEFADFDIKLNLSEIAKKMPQKVQEIIKGVKVGDWRRVGENKVQVSDVFLQVGEDCEITLIPKNPNNSISIGDGLVVLDENITEPLFKEGLVRDVVRFIQNIRKESGFFVIDRVELELYSSNKDTKDAMNEMSAYISKQVLASQLRLPQSESESKHWLNSFEISNGSIVKYNIRKA